jgi:putative oxidoreductase
MNKLFTSLPPPSRNLNIALWVLQALLAAAFIAAGGSKLAGVPHMVALFDQIGVGQWFRYVTGAVEIISAVALLVPRTTAYAAAQLAMTMGCAAITHLAFIGGNPIPAIVLASLCAFVAYRRWPRTSPTFP